jgi:alanyl-tRNA synthetase
MSENRAHHDVVDTYRSKDLIAHLVRLSGGESRERLAEEFKQHGTVNLRVDRERRFATMRNHTATHLVHAALRRVLGDHVTQAGSLVAPDRLRFDFHHFQGMTPDDVVAVERTVNEEIIADLAVTTANVPYKEAIASGAMALFGEKYGDVVRVVTIEGVSRELCGGTHLKHTGEIGAFFIRQEGAVASGIRRVEAVTGTAALDLARRALDDWGRVAALLRVSPAEVERRIRALLEENEALARKQRREEAGRAKDLAADALAGATDAGGIRFVALEVEVADLNGLRSYGDALRGKMGGGVALLCQSRAEKPVCLVVVGDSAIKEQGIRADDLARQVGAALGFRGGGKAHMAQFGISKSEDFARVRDFLKDTLASR